MLAGALLLWLAADPAALEYRGYVNDFANVIDEAAERDIARYLRRVDEGAKSQVAIVTVPSLDGMPIDDFSFALARKWGIGYKNKDGTGNQADQGVLLVFAINDRKMRLETGRGIEDAIPDGFAGDLLRAARPALRQGQYGIALSEMAHRIGARIAEVRGVTIPDRVARRAPKEARIPWWLIVLGVLILLWFLSQMGGGGGGRGIRRNAGWGGPVILPPFGGGGWGGRSSGGGGFGGYDSSDSFGGFGGGDFGGGGASSDW